MEAVQKWRTEEFHLSGDKQQEEEEESIYTVHYEEVNIEASCSCRNSELKRADGSC